MGPVVQAADYYSIQLESIAGSVPAVPGLLEVRRTEWAGSCLPELPVDQTPDSVVAPGEAASVASVVSADDYWRLQIARISVPGLLRQ